MSRRKVIAVDVMPEVVARYQTGESAIQIAEWFQCSPRAVRDALRRAGVEIRPVGRPRRFAGLEAQIAAEYEAGASQAELAAKYRTNTTTVRVVLREQGVETTRGRRYRQPSV